MTHYDRAYHLTQRHVRQGAAGPNGPRPRNLLQAPEGATLTRCSSATSSCRLDVPRSRASMLQGEPLQLPDDQPSGHQLRHSPRSRPASRLRPAPSRRAAPPPFDAIQAGSLPHLPSAHSHSQLLAPDGECARRSPAAQARAPQLHAPPHWQLAQLSRSPLKVRVSPSPVQRVVSLALRRPPAPPSCITPATRPYMSIFRQAARTAQSTDRGNTPRTTNSPRRP